MLSEADSFPRGVKMAIREANTNRAHRCPSIKNAGAEGDHSRAVSGRALWKNDNFVKTGGAAWTIDAGLVAGVGAADAVDERRGERLTRADEEALEGGGDGADDRGALEVALGDEGGAVEAEEDQDIEVAEVVCDNDVGARGRGVWWGRVRFRGGGAAAVDAVDAEADKGDGAHEREHEPDEQIADRGGGV